MNLLSGDAPSEQNLLAVTYEREAETFVDDWRRHVGQRPARMGVVNVGKAMRSVASPAGDSGRTPERNVIRAVEDPTDFAAVRATVDDYLTKWPTETNRTVVSVDSLTTPLERTGLRAVTCFLDDLLQRVQASGATGYVCLATDGHDDRTVEAIESSFGTVIEVSPDTSPSQVVSAADTDAGGRDADLAIDDAFELLSVARRRYVLHCLVQETEPVAVGELAERVAAWEAGTTPEKLDADDRERVYASLYQIHLRKLADADVIEYDERNDLVTLLTNARRIEPYLTLAAESDFE